MAEALKGAEVIKRLADTYQQLYVSPGAEGEIKYADIVKRGLDAKSRTLTHFTLNDNDILECESTPAGDVMIVTLYDRNDFETFLKIMANRCKDVDIPKTQGAALIDGVINWTKINKHKEEYIKSENAKGNVDVDWTTEFKRFTSDSRNFKDTIIVLSVGPYSDVTAEEAGYNEDEWLRYSGIIRKYHECTHFVCRKMYPDKIDAVWDELVADAVGLYAAFNKFDVTFAKRLLGIKDGHYIGGRLENYVDEGVNLEELAMRINNIYREFNATIEANAGVSPYELVTLLEQKYSELFE